VGGVRGEGRGGGGGRGPAHRRRAASPRRPAPRPSHPPGPPQNGDTALDDAKKQKHTEVIKLLENAPAIAEQVGRAAPPLAVRAPQFACAALPRDRYLRHRLPCDRSPTMPYL
jgi:hypothetical protein